MPSFSALRRSRWRLALPESEPDPLSPRFFCNSYSRSLLRSLGIRRLLCHFFQDVPQTLKPLLVVLLHKLRMLALECHGAIILVHADHFVPLPSPCVLEIELNHVRSPSKCPKIFRLCSPTAAGSVGCI